MKMPWEISEMASRPARKPVSIANPPPYAETIAFLRDARPPGEYSRRETEKRIATRAAERAAKLALDIAFKAPGEVPAQKPASRAAVRARRRPKSGSRPSLKGYYGEPCAYCERPMLGVREPTREHKTPRILGGSNRRENITIVCRPCNMEKGALTLDQFAERLARHGDPRAVIVQKVAQPAPDCRFAMPPPQTTDIDSRDAI